MRSKIIVIGILLLSLAFNMYQWKMIKSNKQTEQASLSRNMSILGSDFIQASSSIENTLTDTNRDFQIGRASAFLMDASFRADEMYAHDKNDNRIQAWYYIGRSMDNSHNKMVKLITKANLDENDVTQLNNIKQLLDVYIEMMKKSNANTGYIEYQSLLEAEKAADQFSK
ncbi:hypothetical protein SAMN05216378_3806 [Paenibacillus catalpae]|uniref:Uncharacterized protein n=1 Tax=Paenibacillus catalpae TaxID=1045775 RepID=A0A1I2C5C4_9BACL|nr:hypothetical protein [Paenibacillus catalpae]SFE63484.1 hypothetical protein SAMN05216378_3806 [Paenibacillus catalpae]